MEIINNQDLLMKVKSDPNGLRRLYIGIIRTTSLLIQIFDFGIVRVFNGR